MHWLVWAAAGVGPWNGRTSPFKNEWGWNFKKKNPAHMCTREPSFETCPSNSMAFYAIHIHIQLKAFFLGEEELWNKYLYWLCHKLFRPLGWTYELALGPLGCTGAKKHKGAMESLPHTLIFFLRFPVPKFFPIYLRSSQTIILLNSVVNLGLLCCGFLPAYHFLDWLLWARIRPRERCLPAQLGRKGRSSHGLCFIHSSVVPSYHHVLPSYSLSSL